MAEKIDWEKEIHDSAKFNKKQESRFKWIQYSVTDSWLLSILYTRCKKLKDIRDQASLGRNSTFKSGIKIMSKIIDDEETIVLFEMEIRELLTSYDVPGDDVLVIPVSGLKAIEGENDWEIQNK